MCVGELGQLLRKVQAHGGLRPSSFSPAPKHMSWFILGSLPLSAQFFRHKQERGSQVPPHLPPALPFAHPPSPTTPATKAERPHSLQSAPHLLGQGWFQESHTSLGSFGMAKWAGSLPLRLLGSDRDLTLLPGSLTHWPLSRLSDRATGARGRRAAHQSPALPGHLPPGRRA